MASKDVIKKSLAKKIGIKTDKDLFPIFASGKGFSFSAGARQLEVPAFNGPNGLILEVADANGEEHYTITRQHKTDTNTVIILLDAPLSRDFTNATVTIAGGHKPAAMPDDHIVLESYTDQYGARITQVVPIDAFDAMFGANFPATLAIGAKANAHSKLKVADTAPDAEGKAADRGYGRFFDQWKAEGLIL